MSSSLPSSSFKLVFLRRRLRPLFISILALATAYLVLVSLPTQLERLPNERERSIDLDTLKDPEVKTLATGIPAQKIPEYTVDQFQYLATRGPQKLWRMVADKAFLYQSNELVHTRRVNSIIYDDQLHETQVTALEGKYLMGKKTLELFGEITAVLPDGFTLKTDYLRYEPDLKMIIIPAQYKVRGQTHPKNPDAMRFNCNGMTYAMDKQELKLLSQVEVEDLTNPTTFYADLATVDRVKRRATFSMQPTAPSVQPTPVVRIEQPTLYARAKRAEVRLGNQKDALQHITLIDEVLIKEKVPAPSQPLSPQTVTRASLAKRKKKTPSLRYATAGRAEFDAKKNVIRLSEFPQAYQDDDTVTGEAMLFHRDSELIEILQSNAVNQ